MQGVQERGALNDGRTVGAGISGQSSLGRPGGSEARLGSGSRKCWAWVLPTLAQP